MVKAAITESITHVQAVIRESARNGERLVELKERLMKRNAREDYRMNELKGCVALSKESKE